MMGRAPSIETAWPKARPAAGSNPAGEKKPLTKTSRGSGAGFDSAPDASNVRQPAPTQAAVDLVADQVPGPFALLIQDESLVRDLVKNVPDEIDIIMAAPILQRNTGLLVTVQDLPGLLRGLSMGETKLIWERRNGQVEICRTKR